MTLNFFFYVSIFTPKELVGCNMLSFLLSDSEFEELGEQLPRYRPDSIAALRRATRFTEPELKRLYRGFKAECPTGVVKEDTFKLIYSQFFPQGGKFVGKQNLFPISHHAWAYMSPKVKCQRPAFFCHKAVMSPDSKYGTTITYSTVTSHR